MSSTRRSHAAASIPAALVLSIVLATHALAATWASPLTLQSSISGTWAYPGGLVTLGGSTAIATYVEEHPTTGYVNAQVLIRRSTDGGQSWASPLRLSRTASDYLSEDPATAAHGNDVDVVWTEWSHSAGRATIRYARSLDGGATFSSSVALSSLARVASPSVARGPNGRVAVLWFNWRTNRLIMRVSTDGGATFGASQVLWSDVAGHENAVAIGDGVIYAAHASYLEGILMRRSLDDGATWTESVKLGGVKTARRDLTLTARASEAYLGFVRKSSGGWAPAYRRTTDKGATWSTRTALAAPAWSASLPHFSIEEGLTRTVFGRCKLRTCDRRVFYRETTDGINWTARERVSPAGWATPSGVGYAGRIIVLYFLADQDDNSFIQVRTATP